ncbi:hypothetical protein P367_19615 [Comamonas thiooxydans]|nr:hypothetical protein P369_22965 [Comamonas thiooxydans]KGG96342.1 hypothetical protein P367_19615 [Comamonas thiooxydans]
MTLMSIYRTRRHLLVMHLSDKKRLMHSNGLLTALDSLWLRMAMERYVNFAKQVSGSMMVRLIGLMILKML